MKNRGGSEPDCEPRSLVDLLRWRGDDQAEHIAYTFLADGEAGEVNLTYRELDRWARAIGSTLQNANADGERVLLLFPPGLEYIAAFMGCLYAGAVAVPVYPPRPNRTDPRLVSIAADSQAKIALTTSQILSRIESAAQPAPGLKSLRWEVIDDLDLGEAEKWRDPGTTPGTLAFLQYTSGSTAEPKGVMATHGNLLHNERCIKQAFGQTARSIIVSWLPLYHDMGLIGTMLQPLYVGARCVLMPPASFLQKPFRWLRAISDYRATTSGGPNFAYDLCVSKVSPSQLEMLDLSCWEVAFNGSEPVHIETLRRFADAFQSCGFNPKAFFPCYGLAEATLFVSGGSTEASVATSTVNATALEENRIVDASIGEKHVRHVTSCGRAGMDQNIIIVNPETSVVCPPDQVGEIWVSGPSIAKGYWNRPDLTERTFCAYVTATRQGPFLRTGDLGFIKNGALFVTGRLKDLIIIRGRNHYPHDIERTVEKCQPGLRASSGAAFTVEVEGQERLVVVQEVARDARHLDIGVASQAIRRAVAEEHGAQVYAIVLVKPGSIPKTSSGKIQRRLCRGRFLANELEVLGESTLEYSSEIPAIQSRGEYIRYELLASVSDEERRAILEFYLQECVAGILKLEPFSVPIQSPLTSLGLDSLMAVELQNSIESRLGVDVQMASLLQGIDISTLASNILTGLKEDVATKVPVISSSQNASAEAPLSSGQHRLWFLDQLEPGDPSYNIAVAVRLDGALSFPALEQALNEVMARHEGLRTQFKSLNGEPVQVITAVPTGQILQADLRHLGLPDAQAEALKLAAQESLRSFNLSRAPLFRLTLLRLSDESHTLLLTLPHIIGDGWSVNIFLRELAAIYTDYLAGTPSSLERLAIQYRDFVRWQKDHLRDEVIQAQLSYWKKKLASLRPAIPLPTDHPRPSRTSLRGACHWISLSQEISASLKEVSNREGATLFMTLLATLNILLCRYTRCFDITVGSPIAGRNRSEFEKLIGFFVNTLVLRNDLSGNPEFRELLSRVRKTALEAYDNQDTPFHRLVAEVAPERDLALAPLYRVWFVLQVSQSSVPVFSGLSLSPIDMELQATKFDLALNLTETPQGIKGSFEYSPDLFNKSTIQRMAEDYETLLKLVVSKPEARLDELLDHIDEKDRRQRQLRRETHERSSKEKLGNMKRRVVTRR